MNSMQKLVSKKSYLVVEQDSRTCHGVFDSLKSAKDWADELNDQCEETYEVEIQE